MGSIAVSLCAVAMVAAGAQNRSIDGSGNNGAHPEWGSAGSTLRRVAAAAYADGVQLPAGTDRPSAREVSNHVAIQLGSEPMVGRLTDMFWQWGQFLDHDIDLTETANPAEPFAIAVPTGDPYFDPTSTGTKQIDLQRSDYDPSTGTGPGNPRQQLNAVTAYVDASQVYGSDATRAADLRLHDGSGRLRTSPGNLLPFNTAGLPNAGGPGSNLFIAGDVRCNEQVGLISMHTLFMREHNRLCGQIASADPALSGDEIYEQARKIVGAYMQVITYRDWLPLLLGTHSLGDYAGYDPTVDAGIANEFSTAAFRLGHSMLSPQLERLDSTGQEIAAGHLSLRDAFFAPYRVTNEGGIEPIVRGLCTQIMQDLDPLVVDDVRNFLFGAPGAGGFDLAALNIQRGRDHGLPTYNDARMAYGLAPATTFAQITSSPMMQQRLMHAYDSPADVDLWIGGLAENLVPGGMLGELFCAIVADQFDRLRAGDAWWYENDPFFDAALLAEIQNTTLTDIIRRNSSINLEMQDNIFIAPMRDLPAVSLPGMVALCGGLLGLLIWRGCRRSA